MPSHAEQVLDKLKAVFAAALPYADVTRNQAKAAGPGPGGSLVINDGDRGDYEEFFSPHSYTWNHRVVLDLAALATSTAERWEVMDALLMALDGAIGADRTLAGLCEWLEPESPTLDDAQAQGTEPIRRAQLGLICVYTTTSPLA